MCLAQFRAEPKVDRYIIVILLLLTVKIPHGQERLLGLALSNVHREISVFVEHVIDRFSNSKRRLLYLVVRVLLSHLLQVFSALMYIE